MEKPNSQTWIFALTGATAVGLMITAALFSSFFDLGSSETFFYIENTNCQGLVSKEQETDSIPPLDASEEEILNSDGALLPAEILGLHQKINQLNHPGQATGARAPSASPKTSRK